ncbi:MAG: hypothetical protein JWM31_1686, partial [Solirubrobacterales bacterium]|nr:hypothetical protein [Solirubrobacterales bacterium]
VFATSSTSDQVVPPGQLKAFKAADPAADAQVIPGPGADPPDSVVWMHSAVSQTALSARLDELRPWLDRVVPRRATAAVRHPTTAGAGCDLVRRATARRGRYKLMLAGGSWRQTSTTGQPITATRGCSGSARWQDDGMSLWALPSPAKVPAAAQASLVLRSARAVRHLSATFRGFLARPREWSLGLYASPHTHGSITVPVAACVRGTCSHLRLVDTPAGALIAAEGSTGQPDQRETPIEAGFALPAGSRRVMWRLRCVAPAGCSLAGIAKAGGVSARRRDPLGHPAIFSVYRVAVR